MPLDASSGDDARTEEIVRTGKFNSIWPAKRQDGLGSAVKIVRRTDIDAEELRRLRNEVQLLYELDHPNVIKLHGWYEEQDAFYMAVELCDGEWKHSILFRGYFGQDPEECSISLIRWIANGWFPISSD